MCSVQAVHLVFRPHHARGLVRDDHAQLVARGRLQHLHDAADLLRRHFSILVALGRVVFTPITIASGSSITGSSSWPNAARYLR